MPIIKLNKSTIDRIPLTDRGQTLYHDDALKGFVLRVGTKTKTYCVYHTVKGKARQINIGRHGVFTVEQARHHAREKLYMMANGVDPEQDKRDLASKQMTLLELVEEFLSVRKRLKPRTIQEYRYYFKKYLPDWMDKPAVDITDKMFLEKYLWIGENKGKAVANNVRRYASSIFNYAIAAHELVDKNPVQIIARTRSVYPDRRKTNVITPSQLAPWWTSVEALPNPDMRDFLKLILLTGLRRSEASSLKWSDISFAEKTLTVPETKNGDPLRVPIGEYLFGMLEKRAETKTDDWVFPSSGKGGYIVEPKKAVNRVRKTSGVQFTIHDLRRTYMTIAASLDISAYALKRLVNHKTSHDVTGGYIILGIEQLREPVQKIERYILEKANVRNENHNEREIKKASS